MDINHATQNCKPIPEASRPNPGELARPPQTQGSDVQPGSGTLRHCERCGLSFTSRSSGGKQQRFCSSDCRRAFHDKPQRDNVHVGRSASQTLPAVMPPPAAQNAPADASEDFDWSDVDGETIAAQHETAIYWNPKGDLVIRQRSWHDDDSLIFISKENVDDFLDKLTDVCGIPSVGKILK